jgi:tellurite resistance protein TerA
VRYATKASTHQGPRSSTVCAPALLTNNGGDLVAQRKDRYLVPRRGVSPQHTVDQAYG